MTVNPAKPDNGEIHDIYRTNFFPMDAPLVLVSADPFALEAGKSVGINMVVARNRYRMWCTVHGSGEIWEWSNPTGGSAGVEW